MLDDHAKVVAIRNSDKSEKEFFKYLRPCYWSNDEIKEMWKYAQSHKDKSKIKEIEESGEGYETLAQGLD